MAFRIVKKEELTARMILWLSGICRKYSDFVPGSKIRSKIETLGVELEAAYFSFYVGLKKAIPVAVYNAFRFNLLSAAKAASQITFYASPAPSSDIVIPAGTKVATEPASTVAEKAYVTISSVTLAAGETEVTAPIACTVAGTIGNTGEGTITVLKSSISGITSVSNPAIIANGTDEETEDQRQVRFQNWITTLTRGTDDAIVYGAKLAFLTDGAGTVTERVVQAVVTGPPSTGSAGTATCYIYDGSSGASEGLIEQAQKVIDGYRDDSGKRVPGWKAAGNVVTVEAAETVPQDVTVTVTLRAGYVPVDPTVITTTVKDYVRDQILTVLQGYFGELEIGLKLVKNELVERIMAVDGVYNISLTAPSADVTPAESEIVVAGTLNVTVP